MKARRDKKRKVTIVLDEYLVGVFDKFCRERGYKKSGLIEYLLREYLKREGYYRPRTRKGSRSGGKDENPTRRPR